MTWDDPMAWELVRGVGAIVAAGVLGLLLALLLDRVEGRLRRR